MAQRVTTSNGNPVTDNSNSLTAGENGPMYGKLNVVSIVIIDTTIIIN